MVVTSDLEAPGWLLYEVVLLLSDWGGGGGGGVREEAEQTLALMRGRSRRYWVRALRRQRSQLVICNPGWARSVISLPANIRIH